MKSRNRADISIVLGGKDNDIIAWFNTLDKYEINKQLMIEAIIMAIATQSKLYVGSVIPTQISSDKISDNMNQNIMMMNNQGLKKKKWSTGYRDKDGNYTIGSVVMIHIVNPDIIKAVKDIKSKQINFSKLLKSKIQDGLIIGPENVPNQKSIQEFIDQKILIYKRSLLY